MAFFASASWLIAAVFPAAMLAARPVAVAIPEPGDFALFAMGVIGLLVGRAAAGRKMRDREPAEIEDDSGAGTL